jgi:hypothetical protein
MSLSAKGSRGLVSASPDRQSAPNRCVNFRLTSSPKYPQAHRGKHHQAQRFGRPAGMGYASRLRESPKHLQSSGLQGARRDAYVALRDGRAAAGAVAQRETPKALATWSGQWQLAINSDHSPHATSPMSVVSRSRERRGFAQSGKYRLASLLASRRQFFAAFAVRCRFMRAGQR